MIAAPEENTLTLIDELLAEQARLTAVERFSRHHDRVDRSARAGTYNALLPARAPRPGEQFAFSVDLDLCSGCKACVAGCHSMNGLDEGETWREVGLLHGAAAGGGIQQTVTTACHHCVDPGCLSGCPVKAYDKDPVTGIVRHLDDQCIGCQYCIMKCPYEVPKYSASKGIVRKCDMCVNRLAIGEAPACVQACPNEAIKITLVQVAELKALYRMEDVPTALNAGDASRDFLPDSPDPRITLPTTQFISRRSDNSRLQAADHGSLRLEHPHWPLILMLVMTQAGAGMFLALALGRGFDSPGLDLRLHVLAMIILSLGLVAAPFHLGQPFKAWRAFLGWRTSWLSREIIAFQVFGATATLAIAGRWWHVSAGWRLAADVLASATGLGSVLASAMVYVDTRRPFWAPRFSFGNFLSTTVLLGSSLTATALGLNGAATGLVRAGILVALFTNVAVFIWREEELNYALGRVQSPIHLNAMSLAQLLRWHAPVRKGLFLLSTLVGIGLIIGSGDRVAGWGVIFTLLVLTAEAVGRYGFFAAGASRRMPGGVPR